MTTDDRREGWYAYISQAESQEYPSQAEDLAWLGYSNALYEDWLATQPDVEDDDWEDEYDRAAAGDEYDRY